ncbi:hypothetical protein [Kribbella deserti]|uniref:Uncharacterized protein n=1 Tax=Kribbella deserti TaxID=1926257 RepID=A0ABV6QQ89_9ACTN
MLTLQLSDATAAALGPGAFGAGVAPSELTPKLQGMVAAGLTRHQEILVFAALSRQEHWSRGDFPDLTGWECAVNSFHLDDMVPVDIGWADDLPLISEADQLVMLRQGMGLAMAVVRLARELPEPTAVRCIVATSRTNGTFRFHEARPGESWRLPNLDTYEDEWIAVLDSSSAF